MEVYLIRHGIAEIQSTTGQDDDRALSEEGRKKTRQVAERLLKLDVQLDLLLVSPLLRARQTAQVLVQVGLAKTIEIFTPLAPGGTCAELRERLSRHDAASAGLVGHQPGLGLWAEELIWGIPQTGLEIKKAGVVRIELSQHAPGRLIWLLTPKVLLA
ncbi:MAG: phosphohistidine phosphatase SixA [Gemmatimonadaceae bacterium]|nr:phosphohistidine phosphatase SixA [Gloeobacterales cyanobacterium ES-bin-141]